MSNQFGMDEWGLFKVSMVLEFSNRVVLSPVDTNRIHKTMVDHGHGFKDIKIQKELPAISEQDEEELSTAQLLSRPQPEPQGDLTA